VKSSVEASAYYQFAVHLEEGDLVLMYSDALIEAGDPERGILGYDGLAGQLGRVDVGHPQRLCHSLLDAIAGYRNHAPPDDDTTVALLHHNGGRPPRQSMRHMVRIMGKMFGLVRV